MRRFGLIGIVLASSCLTAGANEQSKSAVKKLAQEMGAATIAGEYGKVMDHTYPAVVKAAGGREKVIEATKALMDKLKDQGITVTKYDVGEPGAFHTEGDNTFVVVPTVTEMKTPKGTLRGKSYLLGISPDGKAWTFVDGAGLQNRQFREKVLPKMPAKLKLPEQSKPELITGQ
jgi:hypothetical protein